MNGISARRGDKLLFENINILLDCGDLLWVVGENGIGKTSFLRICANLLRPDQGDVSWRREHHPANAAQTIAFQTHKGFAKSSLTASEDLSFWMNMMTKSSSQHSDLKTYNRELLCALGLEDAIATKTQHLSAGQSRRLALAKLIAAERPIWIMDEPLAGLDRSGCDLVSGCVATHIARGGIALIASHNPPIIDAPSARRLTLGAPVQKAA